jgi:glutathione synthase/RimK-type ligase-like ATP-grasp enzyme
MLLILTEPGDTPADALCGILDSRRHPYTRLDPAEFPVTLTVSAHISNARAQFDLREVVSGHSVDLRSVDAVWYRRPGRPASEPVLYDRIYREGIEEENYNFLQDLWESTNCRWVPGTPGALRDAEKLHQLVLASQLGFAVPDTLASNDTDDVLAFYSRHDGQIISKRAAFSHLNEHRDQFYRYTERMSRRDLGYIDAVRFCPMIFQAYVPKDLELRITVVGEQIFAAEIYSQQSNHTKHDWRRYDHYRTQYGVHSLPDEVGSLCRLLTKRMQLTFGAIDMIVTPAGEYVFLEINANGQYLWIEEQTGLPITSSIADLLISGSAEAGDN